MDEGRPVAYQVLERGVPVLTSDGDEVGTVNHVVSAEQQDIFHGLVIDARQLGKRFVPAEDIASLHERGVDLRIDSAAVAALPHPGGGAPEYSEDPSESKWEFWAKRIMEKGEWKPRR